MQPRQQTRAVEREERGKLPQSSETLHCSFQLEDRRIEGRGGEERRGEERRTEQNRGEEKGRRTVCPREYWFRLSFPLWD